jgi:hypothetical protein
MDEAWAEVGVESGAVPRPRWVLRHGVQRPVVAVEALTDERERQVYRVRLDDGERVLLIHRVADGRWSVSPVAPPFGPTVA